MPVPFLSLNDRKRPSCPSHTDHPIFNYTRWQTVTRLLLTSTLGLVLTISSIGTPLALGDAPSKSVVSRTPSSSYSGPYAPPSDADKVSIEWLEKLKPLRDRAEDRVNNSFGVSISAFKAVQEVVSLAKEVQALAQSYPDQARPTQLRGVVSSLLQTLYKGRGSMAKGDGEGWYIADRTKGPQVVDAIRTILSFGLLDEKGLVFFYSFVDQYDSISPESKTSVGFPPQFELITAENQREILNLVRSIQNHGPIAADMIEVKLPGMRKTLELLEADEVKERAEQFDATSKLDQVRGFLQSGVEKNLTDEAIEKKNNNKKEHFFGRDKETEQVLQALTRMEKAHILLTGKAGVGKTTILKILAQKFIYGDLRIGLEQSPIILELPITAVTNPSDPNAIKSTLAQAVLLSKVLNRRVILFVDEAHISSEMTRNAMKSFLTDPKAIEQNGVHIVFATTSSESRTFLSDTAFSRRFVEIQVEEFSKEETITLIKEAYLPRWEKLHQAKIGESGQQVAFTQIDEEAYALAYRFGALEQPHSGNPTAAKELLEGSLIARMRRFEREHKQAVLDHATPPSSWDLKSEDILHYLKEKSGLSLFPGDPHFEEIFVAKMHEFSQLYAGQEGIKDQVFTKIKNHFSALDRKQMTTFAVFGPPGGGKSYLSEVLAKVFFKGAMLTINGAEYKNGGLELNKLTGSPPGTVGSDKGQSVLTRFMKDHPAGGIIKIEEADYMHQDIVQFFTNVITEQTFTDGIGKDWKTGNYILMLNSNIGQEELIPADQKNKLTWEAYAARRRQLTERIEVGDRTIERVREDKLASVFEKFIRQIVMHSNPNGDSSAVRQEAAKQIRRYTPVYVLTPNREELEEAARNKVAAFVRESKLQFKVEFSIPDEVILEVIDVERFQFEKGFSYIESQLEDKLFQNLIPYQSRKGHALQIVLKHEAGSQKVALTVRDSTQGTEDVVAMQSRLDKKLNPWKTLPGFGERIRSFSTNMAKHLKASVDQIQAAKEILSLKLLDWNTRPVFTLLGTTGNGKTEFFRAMGKVLYPNDSQPVFKITGLDHEYVLANYFRPPSSVQSGNEETEFERWFKSRIGAGGGIILFDELLSFSGLTREQIGHRLGCINKLYDLLDEGKLKIGNQEYDASEFVIGITGNSFQEAFKGIPNDPSSEELVEEIRKSITQEQIQAYFSQIGLDPPKVARLGRIFISGPLPKAAAAEAAHAMVQKLVGDIQKDYGIATKIEISSELVQALLDRVTTQELGMRNVIKALETVIKAPFAGILQAIAWHGLEDPKMVQVSLDAEGRTRWLVDGKEVVHQGTLVPGGTSGLEEQEWVFQSEFKQEARNRNPRLQDVGKDAPHWDPKNLQVVAIHEVLGHWATSVALKGRNTAKFVSLVPGDGYGGYVMWDRNEHASLPDLTSLFTDAVIADAGHRAVILKGISSVGGGSEAYGDRASASKRQDDMAHIQKYMDQIIGNRLVEGLSENSGPAISRFKSDFIHEVMTPVTDAVLKVIFEDATFSNFFEELKVTQFAKRDRLDEVVSPWLERGYADQYKIILVKKLRELVGDRSVLGRDAKRLVKILLKDLDPHHQIPADEVPATGVQNPAGDCNSAFRKIEGNQATPVQGGLLDFDKN